MIIKYTVVDFLLRSFVVVTDDCNRLEVIDNLFRLTLYSIAFQFP